VKLFRISITKTAKSMPFAVPVWFTKCHYWETHQKIKRVSLKLITHIPTMFEMYLLAHRSYHLFTVIYLCGNVANQSLITAAFVFSVIKFFI